MTAHITIAQFKPKLLDIDYNAFAIMSWMKQSSIQQSQLIIFPELTLTGYRLQVTDMTERLFEQVNAALHQIRERSSQLAIDVLVGYPLLDHQNYYIAMEYIEKGKTRAIHRKIYLANYGHCKEHLMYTAGSDIQVFQTDIGNIAVLICEDGWHLANSMIAAQMGAEIIVVCAATSVTKEADLDAMRYRWETISSAVGLSQTCYFIYCNRVGSEGEFHYWGGSHIVTPEGKICFRMPVWKEASASIQLSMDELAEVRETLPLLKNENKKINAEYFSQIYNI